MLSALGCRRRWFSAFVGEHAKQLIEPVHLFLDKFAVLGEQGAEDTHHPRHHFLKLRKRLLLVRRHAIEERRQRVHEFRGIELFSWREWGGDLPWATNQFGWIQGGAVVVLRCRHLYWRSLRLKAHAQAATANVQDVAPRQNRGARGNSIHAHAFP